MANRTRYDPFKEILTRQENMSTIYRGLAGRPLAEDEFASRTWSPAVDIYETANEVILKAEIPEVNRKDIDLRIEDNILTLTGMRKIDLELQRKNYYRLERAYGQFSRTFILPSFIDAGKIRIDFVDGILTITMPKRQEPKPKPINIGFE